MIKRGTKVYVWNPNEGRIECGRKSGEDIIGEVINVDVDFVNIKSIMDDMFYRHHISNVYEVGTGPVTNLPQEEFAWTA